MQDDMKKLIAYSSVAHMGFVTIGIFSLTKQGSGGKYNSNDKSRFDISSPLFLCVGVLYDRYHSRMISSYGGLVNIMPRYSLCVYDFYVWRHWVYLEQAVLLENFWYWLELFK